MYDRKTVRRRRAVLGLLVACSLILLTAYFGESRRRRAARRPARLPRGALAVRGRRQPRAQAGARPLRLVRRHARRQGRARRAAQGARRAAREQAISRRRSRAARTRGCRSCSRSTATSALDQTKPVTGARHRSLADALVLDGQHRQGSSDGVRVDHAGDHRDGPRRPRDGGRRQRRQGHADHRPDQRRHGARSPTPAASERHRRRPARRATPTTCCCSACRATTAIESAQTVVTAGIESSTGLDSLLPAGHPDRRRHARSTPTSSDLPAGPHPALRRPARPRLRPGPHHSRTRARPGQRDAAASPLAPRRPRARGRLPPARRSSRRSPLLRRDRRPLAAGRHGGRPAVRARSPARRWASRSA